MDSKKALIHSHTPNLPSIKCECGHEILLLPDLQAMGQAIENHALEHQKKCALTKEETNAIKKSLIAQTLELASELRKYSGNIS
jgi:hypothetical protein